MNEAGEYILTHTPNSFQKMLEGNYSNGFETDVQVLKENAKNHRKASIRGICPVERSTDSSHSGQTPWKFSEYSRVIMERDSSADNVHRLPNAPSLRIHCMYGYGKPTEVSSAAYRRCAGIDICTQNSGATGICKESLSTTKCIPRAWVPRYAFC